MRIHTQGTCIFLPTIDFIKFRLIFFIKITFLHFLMSLIFNIVREMLYRLYGRQERRCLIIGNDASGKTMILYQFKLAKPITTIPTIGFNVETIEYGDVTFTMWDVGGCDKIRPLWRHYYQNTDAIIFVIDSNDRDRLVNNLPDDIYGVHADSGISLLLREPELRNSPSLICAKKKGLSISLNIEEISITIDPGVIMDRDAEFYGRPRRQYAIFPFVVLQRGMDCLPVWTGYVER